MRKIIYILLALVFFVAFYFLLSASFPKSLERYPLFVILFLLDAYLWVSIRKRIFRQITFVKYLITFLYWAPLILLAGLFAATLFEPVRYWGNGFRTYSFGFVFIAYAAKIFTVIFLIIADLIRMARYVFRFLKQKRSGKPVPIKGQKITRSKFIINLGLITGGIAFSGFLMGMFKWVYDFRVRHTCISLKNLPETFNGLRIVQISDLHLGSWANPEPLREVVRKINMLKPDLVFFTGDLVNFATFEAFDFEGVLQNIYAEYGIYAVLGNHDYGDYSKWDTQTDKQENMQQLYDLYKRMKWMLLRNENEILEIDGDQIAIVGVENWSSHSRFPKYGNMEEALYGLKVVPVKLLLSHDPSHWEKVISRKYLDIDVTFSGHTHGFQFGIETTRFRWSPAQYVYKHWAGLYKDKIRDQYIYVNRGTGFIGYPGRIGILPEITLIELSKE